MASLLFFFLKNFNYKIFFSFSLYKPLPYIFLHSFSYSWSLFSLIAFACFYVLVYTYIFLNTSCSVYILSIVYYIVIVYKLSCCPLDTRQPDILFPGKGRPSHSQLFSVAYWALCTIEAPWDFPHPVLACLLLLSLFTSCLGSHVGGILWV